MPSIGRVVRFPYFLVLEKLGKVGNSNSLIIRIDGKHLGTSKVHFNYLEYNMLQVYRRPVILRIIQKYSRRTEVLIHY